MRARVAAVGVANIKSELRRPEGETLQVARANLAAPSSASSGRYCQTLAGLCFFSAQSGQTQANLANFGQQGNAAQTLATFGQTRSDAAAFGPDLGPGAPFRQLAVNFPATSGQPRISPGSPGVTFRDTWRAAFRELSAYSSLLVVAGLPMDSAIVKQG